MKILLVVFILMGLAGLGLWMVSTRYITHRKADQIHFVRAKDGWPIALHRFLPALERKGLLPVIMCHGLGVNRHNFDLDDRFSLARIMADRGYDVFIIELRGVGKSRYRKWFQPYKWDICFDDFIEKDIPAAVDYVLELTGRPQVHWIGHSMGGMAAYCFCQMPTGRHIKSACAVASPGHLGPLKKGLGKILFLKPLMKMFPVIHQRFFVRLSAPILGLVRLNITSSWVVNNDNIGWNKLVKAAINLIVDVPTSQLMQFAEWLRHGGLFSLEGYSYFRNLDKVKTPFLLLSGEDDKLAPYSTVRPVYERISSRDKVHVHFSAENGTTDYGHGDIIFGEDAPLEVFPVIIDWIDNHG